MGKSQIWLGLWTAFEVQSARVSLLTDAGTDAGHEHFEERRL